MSLLYKIVCGFYLRRSKVYYPPKKTLVIFLLFIIYPCAYSQPIVKRWVSSEDMKKKMASDTNVVFSPVDSFGKSTIIVNDKIGFQTIIGLGSSLEHSTCYNISLLPPDRQKEVLESIVDENKGIGMNLMRICFGTADFTASPWYSYDDPPDGKPDLELKHFSIEKDRKYVLPIIKLALKINPELKFFASPWSPPAWMKTNKSMCGGKINPQYSTPFAEYLVKSVEAYREEGIDIIAITIQNEPEYFPDSYPTCGWTAEQQRDFIRDHLGPVFERHNLTTKIWCYDHNFNHPNYPVTILKDPQAAKYIDGTGFHLYEGKPSTMTWLHKRFPDKHLYFTEGSTFDIPGAIEIISYFRNWARCYNAWVTVIDHEQQPNPGPHDCSPTCIVLNSKTLELKYRFDYYMYGHFMKYIKRGAIRIDSTPSKQIPNVAFKNPNGSIVLITVNPAKRTRKFTIGWAGRALKMELDPKSIATLIWRP
jgi:glucosylceramidase